MEMSVQIVKSHRNQCPQYNMYNIKDPYYKLILYELDDVNQYFCLIWIMYWPSPTPLSLFDVPFLLWSFQSSRITYELHLN